MSPPPRPASRSARWSAVRPILAGLFLTFVAATSAQASLGCSVGVSPLTFPDYNPSSTSDNVSTGYIEVRCTCTFLDCVLLPYKIELQAGSYGTITDRKMKRDNGSDLLKYAVYRDIGMQQNFGTGTSAINTAYLLALFGANQRTTIWGKMVAGQPATVGLYKDAPAIVITY